MSKKKSNPQTSIQKWQYEKDLTDVSVNYKKAKNELVLAEKQFTSY